MIFAATAAAQDQDPRMMERILNPDRDRANPMGAKAFEGRPFAGREFQGARDYTGVKAARTKEFATREFLGIRNPWFGRKVFQTEAARELNRYVLADREYGTREVAVRAVPGGDREAAMNNRTEAESTRAFLGRGKSQEALGQQYSTAGALSIDEVRELLNRNR
jgi:hypothetical protein